MRRLGACCNEEDVPPALGIGAVLLPKTGTPIEPCCNRHGSLRHQATLHRFAAPVGLQLLCDPACFLSTPRPCNFPMPSVT